MRRLLLGGLAASLLAYAPAASASVAGPGYISAVFTFADGTVVFDLSGARTTSPACQTYSPQSWAFNGSGSGGPGQLAELLTAYSMHRKVVIVGNDTCGNGGNREIMAYFYTYDQ